MRSYQYYTGIRTFFDLLLEWYIVFFFDPRQIGKDKSEWQQLYFGPQNEVDEIRGVSLKKRYIFIQSWSFLQFSLCRALRSIGSGRNARSELLGARSSACAIEKCFARPGSEASRSRRSRWCPSHRQPSPTFGRT